MDSVAAYAARGRVSLAEEETLRSLVADLGIAIDVTGLGHADLVKGVETWLEEEVKGTDGGSVALRSINSFLDDQTGVKPTVQTEVKTEESKVEKLKEDSVTVKELPRIADSKIRLHRDFKISRSIDLKSGISYNSVIRQIESGLNKGYTEADLVNGIITVIPTTSGLRSYLEGRGDLALANARGLLRARYNEKSATERYTELGAAKQLSGESPTDFLMRTLDLRNKILFASKESSTTEELRYSPELVKGLFTRTLATGLQDLAVRQEFKALLETDANDEELIQGMNNIVSRENERKKKFGHRDLKVIETKELEDQQSERKIQELQDQIGQLKELVVASLKQKERSQENVQARNKTRRKCSCDLAGTSTCDHCFKCGDSDHFMRGCRQRKSENDKGLSRTGKGQS